MTRNIAAVAIVIGVILGAEPLGPVRASDEGHQGERFGPWLVAVNLGPIVNSAFGESGSVVSADGLSLYFQSGRDSADADLDIFVCHRAAIDLPWGPPVSLGATINTTATDVAPSLSRDGQYLFFSSNRSGNFDVYVSHRGDPGDDFGWEAPVALPSPINGPSFDAGAWLLEIGNRRPQLYFVSDRANGLGQAGLDVYVSELDKNGAWTAPEFQTELNTAFQDNRPSVRFDGLEIVFTSNRDGNLDVYVSHRDHIREPWSAPERLGAPINTAATDAQATFSANGRTLYFASNRPGGTGTIDLYASTRARVRPRDRS